jgi:hypothetical protein
MSLENIALIVLVGVIVELGGVVSGTTGRGLAEVMMPAQYVMLQQVRLILTGLTTKYAILSDHTIGYGGRTKVIFAPIFHHHKLKQLKNKNKEVIK